MFSKLQALTGNTFTETVRQPIFGVLMWVGVGALIINPSIAAYSLASGNDNKILMDVGLSTLLLYGLLSSVFSAVGVITRELESQTVLTVVSKPVPRPLFLLGKYLGVTGAVLFGFLFLSIVFLLTVRHGVMETSGSKYDQPVLTLGGLALLVSLLAAAWGNYVYGWHFPSTLSYWVTPLAALALVGVLFIGPQWQGQSPLKDFGNGQILYALLMILGAVLILTAFAVTLSTRFSQVVTLVLCCGVFVLSLLSDYYFGRPAMAENANLIHKLLYAVVPNSQFFWAGDALTQEQLIPFSQVVWVLGYAGLYSLAVLNAGVVMFQTREVS